MDKIEKPQSITNEEYRYLNSIRGLSKYFNSKKVGSCMLFGKSFFDTNSDVSYNNFFNKYMSYSKSEGLPTFKELAEDILSNKVVDIDKDKLVDYIEYRVISQTYNGIINEFILMDELNKIYSPEFKCEFSSDESDKKYAIDLILRNTKTQEPIIAVQVKPYSFLVGTNPSLMRDKHRIEEKHKQFFNLTNTPVMFYYYGKEDSLEEFFDRLSVIFLVKSIY